MGKKMKFTDFLCLWLVFCWVTSTRALLCYQCTWSAIDDNDKACQQHPHDITLGLDVIDCHSFCITAKVINAETGQVRSFTRMCDSISRGNQCVRDSKFLTCFESCTEDSCNNGNPDPRYLKTVTYADYTRQRGQYSSDSIDNVEAAGKMSAPRENRSGKPFAFVKHGEIKESPKDINISPNRAIPKDIRKVLRQLRGSAISQPSVDNDISALNENINGIATKDGNRKRKAYNENTDISVFDNDISDRSTFGENTNNSAHNYENTYTSAHEDENTYRSAYEDENTYRGAHNDENTHKSAYKDGNTYKSAYRDKISNKSAYIDENTNRSAYIYENTDIINAFSDDNSDKSAFHDDDTDRSAYNVKNIDGSVYYDESVDRSAYHDDKSDRSAHNEENKYRSDYYDDNIDRSAYNEKIEKDYEAQLSDEIRHDQGQWNRDSYTGAPPTGITAEQDAGEHKDNRTLKKQRGQQIIQTTVIPAYQMNAMRPFVDKRDLMANESDDSLNRKHYRDAIDKMEAKPAMGINSEQDGTATSLHPLHRPLAREKTNKLSEDSTILALPPDSNNVRHRSTTMTSKSERGPFSGFDLSSLPTVKPTRANLHSTPIPNFVSRPRKTFQPSDISQVEKFAPNYFVGKVRHKNLSGRYLHPIPMSFSASSKNALRSPFSPVQPRYRTTVRLHNDRLEACHHRTTHRHSQHVPNSQRPPFTAPHASTIIQPKHSREVHSQDHRLSLASDSPDKHALKDHIQIISSSLMKVFNPAAYPQDNIDDLISTFRQHPENRYPILHEQDSGEELLVEELLPESVLEERRGKQTLELGLKPHSVTTLPSDIDMSEASEQNDFQTKTTRFTIQSSLLQSQSRTEPSVKDHFDNVTPTHDSNQSDSVTLTLHPKLTSIEHPKQSDSVTTADSAQLGSLTSTDDSNQSYSLTPTNDSNMSNNLTSTDDSNKSEIVTSTVHPKQSDSVTTDKSYQPDSVRQTDDLGKSDNVISTDDSSRSDNMRLTKHPKQTENVTTSDPNRSNSVALTDDSSQSDFNGMTFTDDSNQSHFNGMTSTDDSNQSDFNGITLTDDSNQSDFNGMTLTDYSNQSDFNGMTLTDDSNQSDFNGMTLTDDSNQSHFNGMTLTDDSNQSDLNGMTLTDDSNQSDLNGMTLTDDSNQSHFNGMTSNDDSNDADSATTTYDLNQSDRETISHVSNEFDLDKTVFITAVPFLPKVHVHGISSESLRNENIRSSVETYFSQKNLTHGNPVNSTTFKVNLKKGYANNQKASARLASKEKESRITRTRPTFKDVLKMARRLNNYTVGLLSTTMSSSVYTSKSTRSTPLLYNSTSMTSESAHSTATKTTKHARDTQAPLNSEIAYRSKSATGASNSTMVVLDSKSTSAGQDSKSTSVTIDSKSTVESPDFKSTSAGQYFKYVSTVHDSKSTPATQFPTTLQSTDSKSTLATHDPKSTSATQDFKYNSAAHYSKSTSAAQDSKSTSVTRDSKSTSVAQDPKSTSADQYSKSTLSTQDSKSISVTQDSKSTSLAQDPKSTSADQYSKSTLATQDSKSTLATQNFKSTSESQDSKYTSVAQDSKSTSAAHDSKSTSEAHDPESSSVTQDSKSTLAAQYFKSTSVTKDSKYTLADQESISTLAAKDSKSTSAAQDHQSRYTEQMTPYENTQPMIEYVARVSPQKSTEANIMSSESHLITRAFLNSEINKTTDFPVHSPESVPGKPAAQTLTLSSNSHTALSHNSTAGVGGKSDKFTMSDYIDLQEFEKSSRGKDSAKPVSETSHFSRSDSNTKDAEDFSGAEAMKSVMTITSKSIENSNPALNTTANRQKTQIPNHPSDETSFQQSTTSWMSSSSSKQGTQSKTEDPRITPTSKFASLIQTQSQTADLVKQKIFPGKRKMEQNTPVRDFNAEELEGSSTEDWKPEQRQAPLLDNSFSSSMTLGPDGRLVKRTYGHVHSKAALKNDGTSLSPLRITVLMLSQLTLAYTIISVLLECW